MREIPNDHSESQLAREFTTISNLYLLRLFSKFLPQEFHSYFHEVTLHLKLDSQLIQFDCPSEKIAARLLKISTPLVLAVYGVKEALEMGFIPHIEILCSGKRLIPLINPKLMIKESLMNSSFENSLQPNLPQTKPEIDLNELYGTPHPIYITQMSDQKVLFANKIALDVNKRTAGEMVGQEVTALWDDDVLTNLMKQLESDRELWQYHYPGYRWAKEENSPIWRRDRYMFVANYKVIEFLGTVCRLCVITSAEKMRSSEV
ncbi:hypothetical protein NG796_04020 [Laspinema sp. A4]|uniref:hypothetical protein n=1 Tax=Laspinema sp. D2d TaxID=2953686 RepID=UPI0021BAA083|nr:hypothetical protein [Laspinema sp. D2d]MCT7982452.1 hypothetical protein [Laspinema sp. D2d]